MDGGEERVEDEAARAKARRQARKVYRDALVLTTAVTAAFTLLPV